MSDQNESMPKGGDTKRFRSIMFFIKGNPFKFAAIGVSTLLLLLYAWDITYNGDMCLDNPVTYALLFPVVYVWCIAGMLTGSPIIAWISFIIVDYGMYLIIGGILDLLYGRLVRRSVKKNDSL